MGTLQRVGCKASLVYEHSQQKADEVRTQFDADENSAIVSVAFTIKEGVDGTYR